MKKIDKETAVELALLLRYRTTAPKQPLPYWASYTAIASLLCRSPSWVRGVCLASFAPQRPLGAADDGRALQVQEVPVQPRTDGVADLSRDTKGARPSQHQAAMHTLPQALA